MTAIRVRGLNKVRAKGRLYIYHRKTRTRITAEPGTAEFFAQLQAAERRVRKPTTSPGTIGSLIAAYRACPFWTELAPKTRLSYDRAFDVLKPIEEMPLSAINAPFMAELRNKVLTKRGRWMANYVLTVTALIFDFARERGWMSENPARGVRRVRRHNDAPRVNRPWMPAECRAVLEEAPSYLRVPIALAMFAGFRKGDVLSVEKSALQDGAIAVRTRKRGRMVRIPLHPTLAKVLAEAPSHKARTLAANSRGISWTESGFNSTFFKFIQELEKDSKVGPGLTMHGLRHTLGTRLKEAGADDRAIADILGQASVSMAHHYSQSADTTDRDRRLLESADLFGDGNKERKPR